MRRITSSSRIGRRGRAGVALLAMVLLASLTPASTLGAQTAVPDRDDIPVRRLAGGDRIATAVEVSKSAFPAASTALLARAGDFADALVAAPLAAAVAGPILLTHTDTLPPATEAELDRLGVEEVLVMGGDGAVSPAVVRALEEGGRTVRRIAGESRYHTAEAAAAELDAEGGTVLVATGEAFPDALAAGPMAAAGGQPIVLVTAGGVPAPAERALRAVGPERIVILGGEGAVGPVAEAQLADIAPTTRLAGPTRFGTAAEAFDAAVSQGLDPDDLWLADGRDFPDALVAGPVIGMQGGTLLLVDGRHLASQPAPYDRIRARAATLERVTLLGGSAVVNGDAPEQLQGVALGSELPRGGRLLFPQHRMVALYGNARSNRMGALGEQPPEQAAERTKRVASEWEIGPRTILPTFELIVTVAQRDAGADGMYRTVASPEEIQPYLDVARRHGIYLLLDVQPGRSDFLTEVRRYEQFLLEPDVGIALDPEWRMHGNTRPGQEVGYVHADEVNGVVDYVAGLVREHRLPQKLFVVHQFTRDMIRERDRIRTPDELSVNFHADGFGGRAAKLSKYESFLAPRPHSMGFKLFYDEDTNMFAPRDVLAFRVPPDLITYQ
jgi:putative cell wall-binding protein